MSNKPKVSVAVDQETYDRYKVYADRSGMKLSQWVRHTLSQAAPKVDTGANNAFRALDEAEKGPLRPPPAVRRIEPLPPAPPPKKPVEEQKGLPPGHPCRFFTREACRHTIMGGRPCRWPAPVATNCDAFVKLRRP